MDADAKRKMRSSLRDKMCKVAELRRCPSCRRGFALKRVPRLCPSEPMIIVCRYCGFETARTDKND